jgi:hypothetical protein
MGEICARKGGYLSHVELEALSELAIFLSTGIAVNLPVEEIHLF